MVATRENLDKIERDIEWKIGTDLLSQVSVEYKECEGICANEVMAWAKLSEELGEDVNKCVIVKYYNLPKTKAMSERKRMIAETETKKEKMLEEEAKRFEGMKSQYVTCKTCGSKLHTKYDWTKELICPVCHGDMKTDTYHKRLEGYNEKIERLTEEYEYMKEKQKKKKANTWFVCRVVLSDGDVVEYEEYED